MPTGLRILDQLGCYDALLAEAQNVVDTMDYRDENGESITTTDGLERLASERYVLDILPSVFLLINVKRYGYPLFWIARTNPLKVLHDCITNKSKILTQKGIASVQRLEDTLEVTTTTDGPVYCGEILVRDRRGPFSSEGRNDLACEGAGY
jgi:2-polyprenyl-6-methoxyphenol hydroxylase-like FAD-dependent oxidoreductase